MARNWKIVFALTASVAFVLVACTSMTDGLIARMLAPFPDYPEPPSELSADDEGELYFSSLTPYDLDVILGGIEHALPTTGIGWLSFPDGASADTPVPAMILLHGSGGISEGREHAMAKRLNDNGYAAFVVDYYLPRGVQPDFAYMRKTLSVTEFDAIADAYGALRLLSTHPKIDGDRIGVGGFSYGGMATRLAMDERIRRILAPNHRGFAAFVDVYGPCFQVLGTTEHNGSPLLTLRGTEDASNDLAACAKREDELRAVGVDVEAQVYQGAGHAWERTDKPAELFPDAPYLSGCEMVYDENGHSSVDGKPLVAVPVETPRAERAAMRARSGDILQDCVGYGYVIGGDPETAAQANAHLLAFLERSLGR